MANLNDGEVVLILGEDRYILRPTLNAIRNLSRLHNGLRHTFQKIVDQDFEGITQIIQIGAALPERDQKVLGDKLFRAGLNDDTLMPLIDYMKILMNGGRMPSDATPEQPDAEGND